MSGDILFEDVGWAKDTKHKEQGRAREGREREREGEEGEREREWRGFHLGCP